MKKLFLMAFLAFMIMSSIAFSQSSQVLGRVFWPTICRLGACVPASQSSQVLGRVFWRGNVDDRVHLVIQGSKLEHRTISGKPQPEGVYSFTATLPREPVTVEAVKKKGRGEVRVIRQPSDDNDFTAIIEIYDDDGGAKEYQLEIFWR